jgi:DNA-binding NarL/FixJ family response regulator
MKKILIDKALYSSIDKYETVLQRADVKVFTAETNDEILSLHQQEKMNLIIARLDAPGTTPERIYSQVRNDAELRSVSLILVCGDQTADKVRAEHCGANAIVTRQAAGETLMDKANSFLNVPTRGSYRVLLSVTIDTDKSKSFFCRSENISVTGMLLETDRTLAAGDRLNCSFFLPGAKQIEVSCEVARIITATGKAGHKQYGLKFTKISAADIAAIRAFIRKRSERA